MVIIVFQPSTHFPTQKDFRAANASQVKLEPPVDITPLLVVRVTLVSEFADTLNLMWFTIEQELVEAPFPEFTGCSLNESTSIHSDRVTTKRHTR